MEWQLGGVPTNSCKFYFFPVGWYATAMVAEVSEAIATTYTPVVPHHSFDDWLSSFALEPFLHEHVAAVVTALPEHVQSDFLSDPSFSLCDYEPSLLPAHIPLRSPSGKGPSRCVVLKRTLRKRPENFVRWVIAHELAHAHLRNGGRHAGEDPEHAADSLAADWGFPRP